MIKTDQTIFDLGKGNCFAACIASILEIPITEVRHFTDGESLHWREEINEWLSERGYFFIDVALNGDIRDELVRFWGYHLILGESPRRGDVRHAVVGYKGEIIHDPHPSRAGLAGEDWNYGLLVAV